jgi:sugar-specific transcriptional regulator TrmB
MLEGILSTMGLDEKEAKAYEQILKAGEATVRDILRALPYKRGDLYNVLRRLQEKGLILPVPERKVLAYAVTDPQVLDGLAAAKQREVADAKERLSEVRSMYNLALGRPGVRFYEGLEGIQEVMKDSLSAKGELLSYEDIDGLYRHLPQYAKWYEAQRVKNKIRERSIIPDTPMARSVLGSEPAAFRQQRFVPHKLFSFSLEMNIYDDKVFYVTFREPFIAVVIEDKGVADTQRAIFELTWRGLERK